MIFITEDGTGKAATDEYCAAIRDQYELVESVKVVCDPEHQFAKYGKNSLTMITDSSATIVYRKGGPSNSAIRKAIEEVLPL